jgi:hypothetical protein
MKIYKTAGGTYYTRNALSAQTWKDLEEGWDAETQGEFPGTFLFKDWLIEAINSGVIEEVDVIG